MVRRTIPYGLWFEATPFFNSFYFVAGLSPTVNEKVFLRMWNFTPSFYFKNAQDFHPGGLCELNGSHS